MSNGLRKVLRKIRNERGEGTQCTNIISDMKTKISLADTAMMILCNSNQVKDEKEFAQAKVVFGYIIKIDYDPNIVSLFKVILGSKIYYFAVSEGKIQQVAINEMIFKHIANDYLSRWGFTYSYTEQDGYILCLSKDK